jgi:hypothetical protein
MVAPSCHTQSVTATNRVTEQLVSWLTGESFYVSCPIRPAIQLLVDVLSLILCSDGNLI